MLHAFASLFRAPVLKRPSLFPTPSEILLNQKMRVSKVLSGKARDCVIVPATWQVVDFFDTTRQNLEKTTVFVADTGFTLTFESECREGDLCRVRSRFPYGAKPGFSILEFCRTEAEVAQIILNAPACVTWWFETITPLLKAQGFTEISKGELELKLEDGTLIKALPTFFADCVCMLNRKHQLKLDPDFVPKNLESLELMIKGLKINSACPCDIALPL